MYQLFPYWMPDAKTLVFQSSRSGVYQLYEINADGTSFRQITNGESHNVTNSVSDDGQQIAFISSRDKIPQVFLMNADGDNLRQVTQSSENKMRAEISPAGQQILYNTLTPVDGKVKGAIYLINIDGTGNVNLTQSIDGD